MSSAAAAASARPNPFAAFYASTIGKKWIVALTGLGLIGFVVGHLLGNLQIFLPPDYINTYAKKLKDLGPLLWVIRLGLLGIFALHVINTIQLRQRSAAARPEPYAVERKKAASKASLTMIISGLILLAFLIFHLLHFTLTVIPTANVHVLDATGRHDVYKMVVGGFQNPLVSLFYLLSMGLLCMHITHGFQSVFQTLGLRTRRLAGTWNGISLALGWFLFLGNAAIVLAILAGFVK